MAVQRQMDVRGSTLHGLSPLFASLPPNEIGSLAQLFRRRDVPRSAHIFVQDEAGRIAFVIQRGTVKILLMDQNGAEVILAFLGPGELVGEMSLADGLGRSATVIATEPCSLLVIDEPTFSECLRRIPILAHNLAGLLSRRLRLANARIQALATLDVEGRLARQVLDFAQAYGESTGKGGVRIPFRLTQQDLASLVGASRVRVNQVMVDYKRQGFLTIDNRFRITILDGSSLAAIAGESLA